MSTDAASGADADLVLRLRSFLRDYYREDVATLAQRYPSEQQSLIVDWLDLYRFDTTVAEDYIRAPAQIREYLEEALGTYDLPADVDLAGASVRVENLDEEYYRDVGHTRPEADRGELRGIRGQVSQMTKADGKIEEAVFECRRCGSTTTIPQTDAEMQEPHECRGCERQGPFRLDEDASEFADHQTIRLQTPPEEVTERGTQSIDVEVHDDLVDAVRPGERVVAFSKLHLRQKTSGRQKTPYFDLYGEAESFEKLESDFDAVEIAEHKDAFMEVAESDDAIEQIVDSIAPSIKGYDQIKETIAYQLFGGVHKHLPDGSERRGAIHSLLVGDPGLGKTQLIRYATRIAPRSVYTSGKGTTNAGLTAAAVQNDFGDEAWTIKAGALVKAHNGIAGIDELDKMDSEDRGGMLEAMSNQQVSKTAAGQNVTLPAKTTVLAGANPAEGRFDDYAPIAEQVDLHPALISRFDLIFTMKDGVDVERDTEIAAHMNQTAKTGEEIAAGNHDHGSHEEVEPTIPPEVLRAYIAYARQECFPVLSDAADELLQQKYIEIRTANDDEGPIPTTPRILEAMQRLAEASARTRLSDTVTRQDVDRVADIVVSCLEDVGVDPETGEYDADLIQSGTSESQRERKKLIQGIIDELSGDFGAETDEILDAAEEGDIDREQAKHELTQLKETGKIYEPKDGRYRTI